MCPNCLIYVSKGLKPPATAFSHPQRAVQEGHGGPMVLGRVEFTGKMEDGAIWSDIIFVADSCCLRKLLKSINCRLVREAQKFQAFCCSEESLAN